MGFRDPATSSLEQDLLWADPNPTEKGWHENDLRGVSVSFGEDRVFELCKRLNLDLVVRAHQVSLHNCVCCILYIAGWFR